MMKPTIALKRFLEAGPNGRPTSSGELLSLKKASTPEEWQQFGSDAAQAIGETLDED